MNHLRNPSEHARCKSLWIGLSLRNASGSTTFPKRSSLQLMLFCTTLPIKLKLGPFAFALSAIYSFTIWCLNRPQEKGVLSRISSGSFSFPALLTWRVYTKWKLRSQHCAPSSVKNTHKLNHLNLNKVPSGDIGEKKVDGNFSALLKKKIQKRNIPQGLTPGFAVTFSATISQHVVRT